MTFLPNEAFFNVPSSIQNQYLKVMNSHSNPVNDIELVVNHIVEWTTQGIDASNTCHFNQTRLLEHVNQPGRRSTVMTLINNLYDFHQFISGHQVHSLIKSKICYELNDRILQCTPALNNAFAEAILQMNLAKSFNECLYVFRVAVAQKHAARLLKLRPRGSYTNHQYRSNEPHTKNQIYRSADIIFATRLHNPNDIFQGLLPENLINDELSKVKYNEFNFFYVLEGLIEQFKSLFLCYEQDSNFGIFGNSLEVIEGSIISIFANHHSFIQDYQLLQIKLNQIQDELKQLSQTLEQEKPLYFEQRQIFEDILIEKKQLLIKSHGLYLADKLKELNTISNQEFLDFFLELVWFETQHYKEAYSLDVIYPLISLYLKFKQKQESFYNCYNEYEKAKEVFRSKIFICEQSRQENDYLDVIYKTVNWITLSDMVVKELLVCKYFELSPQQVSLIENYFFEKDMDVESRLDSFTEIIQYLPDEDVQSVFLKISLQQFYSSFCDVAYWKVLVSNLLDKPTLVRQLAEFFLNQQAPILQFKPVMQKLIHAYPIQSQRKFLQQLGQRVKDINDFQFLRLYIDDDLAFPIVIRLVKSEQDFLYYKGYLNENYTKQILIYCINAKVFDISFSFLVRNLELFKNHDNSHDEVVYFYELASQVTTPQDIDYVSQQDILLNNVAFLKKLIKHNHHFQVEDLLDKLESEELRNELKLLLKFNRAANLDVFKLLLSENFLNYIEFYQKDFLTEQAKSYLLHKNFNMSDFKQIIRENQFIKLQFLIDTGCLISKAQAFDLLIDCYQSKTMIHVECVSILLRRVGFKDGQIRSFNRIYQRFCARSDYQFFDLRYALFYIADGQNSKFYDLFGGDFDDRTNIKSFLNDCGFDELVLQLVNKTLNLKKSLYQSKHFFLDELNTQKSVIVIDELITGLYRQKVLLYETSDIDAFKNHCQKLIDTALPTLNCQRHKFSKLIEPIMKLIREILKVFGIEKPITKTSELVLNFSNHMLRYSI